MSDQFKEEKIDINELEEVTGGIGELEEMTGGIDGLEEVIGGIGEAEGSAIGLAEVSITKCPSCGSTNIKRDYIPFSSDTTLIKCTCNNCGTSWVKKQVKSSGNGNRPTHK